MIGSLGFTEILFILGLALLIFGPRKLPEIGRTIGRSLAEFRKASTDLKRSLNAEMIEEEMRASDPRRILQDDPVDGAPAGDDPAAGGSGGEREKEPSGGRRPGGRRPGTPAAGDPASGDLSAEAAAPRGSVARGAAGPSSAETSTESEAR